MAESAAVGIQAVSVPPNLATSEVSEWQSNVGAQLLRQGAEAVVYTCLFQGLPCVVKERFSKLYRHPKIDETINKTRLREESKWMLKCRQAGVDVPVIYYVDQFKRLLFMERVFGETVRDCYNRKPSDAVVLDIADKISRVLATLHDEGIIHGDLTTSNFMIRTSNDSVVLIDFGLTYPSILPEDKAVDLYVLERAFISTHPEMEQTFTEILARYGKYSKNGKATLKRLEVVRSRGRKKLAFG